MRINDLENFKLRTIAYLLVLPAILWNTLQVASFIEKNDKVFAITILFEYCLLWL
jgi:hypothetical protein